MAVRTYIVSATDGPPGSLAALAERLRQNGFEITQQLEILRIIVGRANPDLLLQLRALPGVAAIDEEQTLQIVSSESDNE
jgi:hypothetical protein